MRKSIFKKLRLYFIALVVPFMLFSCKDRFDEHYEVPDWLQGNVWETLEDLGNYSIFLKGVELTGYRPIMEGKNILTVMAPNDDAFGEYLQSKGYSEISDMEQAELKKLIGFHLLYYTYNTEKLVNFRPEGDLATDEDKLVNAGLYFKHRTRSQEEPEWVTYTQEMVDENDPENSYRETFHGLIYHQEKYLPVFSSLFFQTRELDAKTNYEYFFPNSSWTAGSNGFNVSNASVTNYEIIADNGYIYEIDAVLEPLNTLMGELKKRDEHSLFAELYDNYVDYVYNSSYSSTYGSTYGVDSVYLYQNSKFPSIGLEWMNTSNFAFEYNAAGGYTIFAPTNDVLNGFYDTFWKGYGYESLKDVDKNLMSYVIGQYVATGMAFPDDFIQENVEDNFGNKVDINPYDIPEDARALCTNGTFYGITKTQLPQYFSSVMGPAFKYEDRKSFMYALTYSGSMMTYGSAVSRYLMFIPDNETMEESGYKVRPVDFVDYLQKQPESEWITVQSVEAQSIVRMHTSQTDDWLNPNETRVLNSQTAFNYLYIKNNEITDNSKFNQLLTPGYNESPFTPFVEVLNDGNAWLNGQTFFINGSKNGIFQEASIKIQDLFGTINDYRYSYYPFLQLLKGAGMIENGTMPFLAVSPRTIVFVPTVAALEKALAQNAIPGISGGRFDSEYTLEYDELDAEQLRNYLLNFFVSNLNNTILDYPFLGSRFSNGSYLTMNYQNLNYTENGNSISISLEGRDSASVIPDYDLFPFVYSDGCFHFIDSVL